MKKAILFFSFVLIFGQTIVFAQDEPPAPAPTPAAENAPEKESEKEPKYEVQLQYSQEKLSRDLGTWQTASLYFERRFAKRQIVWGTYRVSRRNAARDQEFIAGMYKSFGGKWAATTEAMISPTHRYVGKFSVMGEVEKGFKNGFVLHLGGRYTAYNLIKGTTGYGLVEKYWGSNRVAYTLYINKLTTAGTAPTHRIQYNRYFGENSNTVGTAVSFGREHENLFPDLGILRSKTWSVSVSGRFWLTKKTGLNVDGFLHRQGTSYYRRGLNFGIRYRF